jgi:hypothetical protein
VVELQCQDVDAGERSHQFRCPGPEVRGEADSPGVAGVRAVPVEPKPERRLTVVGHSDG